MHKKMRQEIYNRVDTAVRGDPGMMKVESSESGEIMFERNISIRDGGMIHCRFILSVYPDIHKAEIIAIPSPVIHEEEYTAVTKWFLQRRNQRYQNSYGISMEYKTYQKQLALDGMIQLRENPEKDVFRLLHVLERCLADDFPSILDIYFGIIPDRIRSELSKEVRDYQEELGELVES